MHTPFDPLDDLIVVRADVEGPNGLVFGVRLALDTGASNSMISVDALLAAGYDPTAAPTTIPIITASGYENAPRLPIRSLTALGQTRSNFDVLAFTPPPGAG